MNLLVPLAALLGIEVESITERVRNTIIVNVVMALLGLVGISFLMAAGFFALAETFGVIYAALILAAMFLVLALAVYLGKTIVESRRRRRQAEKRRSTETSAFLTTATLTALPVVLRSPAMRTLVLPAAALAAYLLFRDGTDKNDD
jgi:uncharacterized membrane protein